MARVIDLRDPTPTPGEPYVMSYTPPATLRELPGSTGSGATVVPPPAGLRRINI